MIKLSPPRFHVEISFNFDITGKSGRQNLYRSVFPILPSFSPEYGENHRFLAIIRRKKLYPLGKFTNTQKYTNTQ